VICLAIAGWQWMEAKWQEQAAKVALSRSASKDASSAVYQNEEALALVSLVSCKMSLKEQAILTQDEPEGRGVAQAGD